jgi:uncharacterized protein (TIRG00374 family)
LGSARSTSGRRARWSAFLGIAVSIALLWWTLRDVSLAEVWHEIRGVHPGWLGITIVLATCTFPLRTIRWRYLLRLEGEALPLVPLWHATAIGFMANNLLPARAGELARAYAARRLTGVRFTTAFASIAVERVLDGIVLVALLTVATWAGGFDATTEVGSVTIGGIVRGASLVFGGLLVAALVVVHWPHFAMSVVRRATALLLPARWSNRLVAVADGLVQGLEALRRPADFAMVIVWSFAVWCTGAASFWAAFQAFDIAAPWSGALLAQALVAFGVAIPSSPGFFGPFEALTRVSLGLYGVPARTAVSLAVGYHIATFAPITVLGIWSLSRAHLHLADLRGAGQDRSEREGGTGDGRAGGRADRRSDG